MTANGWSQIALFLALILAVTKPLGVFMARVFSREKTFLDPIARPVERLIYRLTGVNEQHEMRWTEYAVAMLLFSAVSMLALYGMQRLQGVLPFNPQKLPGVSPAHLAFNTAASFTTNTNWQAYSGETTMSYFTQMAGLGLSQLCISRSGHCAGDSIHPRCRPASDADHWQFLGRHGAGYIVGPIAVLRGGYVGSRVSRGGAEPQAL